MFLLSLDLALPFGKVNPQQRHGPTADSNTLCNGLQGNTALTQSQCCPISRKLLGALSQGLKAGGMKSLT